MKSLTVLVLSLSCGCFAHAARVGVFTGTFDPPHNGHEEIVLQAIELGELNIVYVATGLASHKPKAMPFEMRFEMMKEAFGKISEVKELPESVLKIILQDRYGEAMDHLVDLHKKDEVFRIVGSDRIETFTDEQIKNSEVKYLVSGREKKYDLPEVLTHHKNLKLFMLPTAELYISSTDIRGLLKKGIFSKDLNPKVSKVIEKIEGAYRGLFCKSLL